MRMIDKTRAFLVAAALMAAASGAAFAGPLEDGIKAYEAGNFYPAISMLQPIAEGGDAKAQWYVGDILRKGYGGASKADAAKWFQRGAEQSYAPAQFSLAEMYLAGEGVAQNAAEAMRLFRLISDTGNATGQYMVGSLYADGRGVEKNPMEAFKWFQLSAGQGNTFARCELGIRDKNTETLKSINAIWCYKKAGEAGMMSAQRSLGWFYMNGSGVSQSYSESARWFRKAAEQGDADAQTALGNYYDDGKGVGSADYAEAAKWYRLAAEQNNRDAQWRLGAYYVRGKGVKQDLAEAEKWLKASDGYSGEATALLERIAHFWPAAAEGDIATAKSYISVRNFAGATQALNATLDPDNKQLPASLRARALSVRGSAYSLLPNFGLAFSDLLEAARLDPNSSEVKDALAAAKYRAGEAEAAKAYADDAARNRAEGVSNSMSKGSNSTVASSTQGADPTIERERARQRENCARASKGANIICVPER